MENLTGSNSVKKAKVVSVIQVEAKIGTGTKEDPVRKVIQYWDLDGNLLAERDLLNDLIPEEGYRVSDQIFTVNAVNKDFQIFF